MDGDEGRLGSIPIFANMLVGAKHFGGKSLVITNKLSAEMLRPCQTYSSGDSQFLDCVFQGGEKNINRSST